MKSVMFLRLFLVLTLTLGFSFSPSFAQDKEKEEETENAERPRGGGGQGQRGGGGQGQRGGGGQGQRGGFPDLSQMTKEERVQWLNERVQQNVVEMIESVELREDQQEAFIKVQAKHETQLLMLQLQGQQVGRDRNKRQAIMGKMQKLGKETAKSMKAVLDKDQNKAYTKKMKERQSQQQGRGGRGR